MDDTLGEGRGVSFSGGLKGGDALNRSARSNQRSAGRDVLALVDENRSDHDATYRGDSDGAIRYLFPDAIETRRDILGQGWHDENRHQSGEGARHAPQGDGALRVRRGAGQDQGDG